MKITISGKAMSTITGSDIYYDPAAYDNNSQGARDAYTALRSATSRRVGKGYSYQLESTPAGAATISDYCRTVGSTFMFESEPETRAEGRALLTAADRIDSLLAAVRCGTCGFTREEHADQRADENGFRHAFRGDA